MCQALDGDSYAQHEASSGGLVLLRFERDTATEKLFALCATTHLTDFTSIVRRDLPSVNRVDPVGDAGLLRNYLKPQNMFPLLVLGVLLTAFGISWCLSAYFDAWRAPELRNLRLAHITHFGYIKTAHGYDALHLEDQLEVYLRTLERVRKRLLAEQKSCEDIDHGLPESSARRLGFFSVGPRAAPGEPIVVGGSMSALKPTTPASVATGRSGRNSSSEEDFANRFLSPSA